MSETNVRGFDKCVIVRSLSLIPPAFEAHVDVGEINASPTVSNNKDIPILDRCSWSLRSK